MQNNNNCATFIFLSWSKNLEQSSRICQERDYGQVYLVKNVPTFKKSIKEYF